MNCAFKIWYRIKDWPLPTRGQWVCHELEFAYGDKVRFNPEADIPTTSSAVQKQALRYLATVNVDASASNIRGKHNRRLRQSVLTFFISTKKCQVLKMWTSRARRGDVEGRLSKPSVGSTNP